MATARLPTPFEERVLDVVAQIPAGRALSYGDVAKRVGEGGPRQVARVLAQFGSGVPWWRVVRADGTPAPVVASETLARLRDEHAALSVGGDRIDWAVTRWLR